MLPLEGSGTYSARQRVVTRYGGARPPGAPSLASHVIPTSAARKPIALRREPTTPGSPDTGPPCSGFRPGRGSAVPLVTWVLYLILYSVATVAKYTTLINTLSVNVLRGSDVCRDSAHKTCKLNRGSRRRRVACHRHRGARARAIERFAIGDDGGVGGTGLAEHRCDL